MLQFILTFIAGSLTVTAYELYRDKRLFAAWCQIRPRHAGMALVCIAVVLASALLLMQVSVLDWGYMHYLTGSSGSVYAQAPASPDPTWFERVLPWWILLSLVLVMPSAAQAEERWFRGGLMSWSWTRRLLMQLAFGMMHMILGIPLYAALAIGMFGLMLSARQLRLGRKGYSQEQALADGVSIHLCYNLMLICIVVFMLSLSR